MVAGNTTELSKRGLDFYPTDPAWVHVLLRYERFDSYIDEPCCGDGVISMVLTSYGYSVQSSDIHDYGYSDASKKDAFAIEAHPNVITNPPYNIATPLINHWLSTTYGKIAVLMRIGYLGGLGRYEEFKGRRPYKIIIVVDRMKHIDRYGKTVSSQFEHIWLIWDNTRSPVDKSILIWDRV